MTLRQKQILANVGVGTFFVLLIVSVVLLALLASKHAKTDHDAWVEEMDARVQSISRSIDNAIDPDWQFTILVNVGEDLDDLLACIDSAFAVCEAQGEVVCGMNITGGCWYSCCPEEVRDE